MLPLNILLPEVAERETRDVTIFPPGLDGIPPGRYGFLETYCPDPDCDCRRVLLFVVGDQQKRVLATISHSFDPPGRDDLVPEQTFLDPVNPQSKWSKALLKLFLTTVMDDAYAARLVRHYGEVKAAVKDPNDPIHERIPPLPGTPGKWDKSRSSGSPWSPGTPLSPGGIRPPPPRRGKKKWR